MFYLSQEQSTVRNSSDEKSIDIMSQFPPHWITEMPGCNVKQVYMQTDRQTNIHIHRLTNIHIHRLTSTQKHLTDLKQTDRPTVRLSY